MLKSLSNLFRTKKKELDVPVNLNVLGADMHSHLIPGIDDGAKTIEDSLLLIRRMHELGFTRLITTPHIMSDYFRNTPEIILSGLESLRKAVAENNIPVKIDAAAEYYLDDGFLKKLDEEPLLTFGDKYLLVEVSYINPPDNIRQILFDAQTRGYRPVLAHPERYPFWYRNMDMYRTLSDSGVLLQINMNSISGYYGPEAKRIAEQMIDEGLVNALGTDMHHEKHLAALERCTFEPYLEKALEYQLINRYL